MSEAVFLMYPLKEMYSTSTYSSAILFSPTFGSIFNHTCIIFIENLSYHVEKEMATHSGILAWRIPWTKDPGGLQSMGLQRVRHD